MCPVLKALGSQFWKTEPLYSVFVKSLILDLSVIDILIEASCMVEWSNKPPNVWSYYSGWASDPFV